MNWRKALFGIVAAAVAGPWSAVRAAPIEAYGHLPSLENIALSPSGKRLAYIGTSGDERSLIIKDVGSKDQPIGMSLNKIKVKLRTLQWADDTHLMITTSNTYDAPYGLITPKDEYFRCIVYDTVTNRLKNLQANGEIKSLDTILGAPIARQVDGKTIIYFEAETFPGRVSVRSLYTYEPKSGVTRRIDLGSEDLRDYLIGVSGDVVAESHLRSGRWFLRYRRGASWQVSPAVNAPIDVPDIVGLGKQSDIAIVSVPTTKAGVYVWRPFSLKDGVLADDDDSLGGARALLSDPASGLAIGTIETTDRTTYTFFDPVTEKHWKAILRAFPNEQVDFMSMSTDGMQVIVKVFGPVDGSSYVLIDMHTGHSTLLGDVYDGVPPQEVGEVRAINYPAADGLNIPGYLTLPSGRPAKGLPLIVLVHGGPASRDDLEFDWWAQGMAAQGYAVLQPQFRGSDGFGGDFMSAGFGQWGRKMQTDVSDGVRFLAAEGTIDPARVCIVGASYGGYAALAGVTVQTNVYRCAVAYAGPADLKRFLLWGRERYDGPQTLRYWERFMGVEGVRDPALDDISPAKLAAKASAPILIMHGKDDIVVPIEQSEIMAHALRAAGKPVEFIALPSEDHWLSRSETRLQMLKALMAFVEKYNPSAPQARVAAASH